MSYSPFWRVLIALGGMLSVGMGAGAAHGLSHILPEQALSWIHTGVMYQLIHLAAALAVSHIASRSGKCWIIGSWLFSGSLYLMACLPAAWLEAWRSVLGPITPIGGVILIVGWGLLYFTGMRAKSE
ncbi:DUF423 domain-containing protein [Celerinatantimonas sp. YJH-8]|uniref:DUF423 domain-containing protein n=1 Tax=Celerinatantimonas sp. YJH-8 TaxID=3228714 RepID=UPI0038BE1E76